MQATRANTTRSALRAKPTARSRWDSIQFHRMRAESPNILISDLLCRRVGWIPRRIGIEGKKRNDPCLSMRAGLFRWMARGRASAKKEKRPGEKSPYRARLNGHRIGGFRQLMALGNGKQDGLGWGIGSGVFRGAMGGCTGGRRWRRRRGAGRGFDRCARG